MIDMDTVRQLSGLAGVIAFAGLGYRLASTWDLLSSLGHVLGLLLGASILLGALGAVALASVTFHDTWATQTVSLALLAHRLLVIGVVVHWGRLLARRPRTGPLSR